MLPHLFEHDNLFGFFMIAAFYPKDTVVAKEKSLTYRRLLLLRNSMLDEHHASLEKITRPSIPGLPGCNRIAYIHVRDIDTRSTTVTRRLKNARHPTEHAESIPDDGDRDPYSRSAVGYIQMCCRFFHCKARRLHEARRRRRRRSPSLFLTVLHPLSTKELQFLTL